MKTKLLLFIFLLSLFTTACDTEEMVQPAAIVQPEVELTSASSVTSVDSYRNNLMVEERFETSLGDAFSKQVYTSHGFYMSSNQSRSGSKAGRFELRQSDNKIRSEILLPRETSKNRWYGISMYLPSSYWATTTGEDAWEIITQLHAFDDPGEAVRLPPISLVVSKGRMLLVMHWSTKEYNSVSSNSGTKRFDLGPVIKDKWLDFVYHINFSYESDGILDVWLNGNKVVDYSGPNSYNDQKYPYFKAGIYKRSWNNISKRALYIDDIRSGNSNATYNDVAPAGSSTNEPGEDDGEDDGGSDDGGSDDGGSPDPDPTTGQKVESFTLINADTDQEIGTINNNATINLASLPTSNINVRANTNTTVGSVYFVLSGAKNSTKIQTGAPYALFGDNNGDYIAWRPPVGSYTLQATPYSGSNKTGTAGTTLTINFKVVNEANGDDGGSDDGGSDDGGSPDPDPTTGQKVESFTLINADTDQEIGTINNNATISLSSLPTSNINVRANTNTTVGSVYFVLSGAKNFTKTEGSAPYALFGDSGGNYIAWRPPLGDYALKCTPYTGASRSGTAGTPLTINFKVVE